MSERINDILIKILENVNDVELTYSKVGASIFIRGCQMIINDKVNYLTNLIEVEAQRYNVQGYGLDKKNFLISNYKQSIENIYNEFYYRYVSILNYLNEIRKKQKIVITNYQIILNNREKMIDKDAYKKYLKDKEIFEYKLKLSVNKEEYNRILKEKEELTSPIQEIVEYKEKYKKKAELYEKVIRNCVEKLEECRNEFENKVNEIFSMAASLQVIDEKNIFQKLKLKIVNLFNGQKNFDNFLNIYITKVNSINLDKHINKIKEDTIEFLTDMIELIDVENNEN